MSCYRTLDSSGRSLAEAQLPHKVDKELALRMYRSMASVQTVDTIFYEAQRQVCKLKRIVSFGGREDRCSSFIWHSHLHFCAARLSVGLCRPEHRRHS